MHSYGEIEMECEIRDKLPPLSSIGVSDGLAALVSPRTPGSLVNQIALFLYRNVFNLTNTIIITKTQPFLTQSNLAFFAPVNKGPFAAILF
jgi:hypothetical protein